MPFPPNSPVTSHARRPAAPTLPFRGLTLLLVEDSRFTCDAMRLICLRAGGRLKRAETLTAARAHLACYRPDVVIVDLGLPDGRGEVLIAEVATRGLPVLGLSGDPEGRTAALAAGAAGFLDKPFASSVAFQHLILGLVGPTDAAALPSAGLQSHAAQPADPLAFRDDLLRAAEMISSLDLNYAASFLRSLGRAAGDHALEVAAIEAASARGCTALSELVADRLSRLDAVG